MQHKYIVYDKHHAVCFVGSLTHAGFDYRNDYEQPRNWRRFEVTSAGFFQLSVVDGKIKVNVFGESESLKIKSDPHDATLIALALGII